MHPIEIHCCLPGAAVEDRIRTSHASPISQALWVILCHSPPSGLRQYSTIAPLGRGNTIFYVRRYTWCLAGQCGYQSATGEVARRHWPGAWVAAWLRSHRALLARAHSCSILQVGTGSPNSPSGPWYGCWRHLTMRKSTLQYIASGIGVKCITPNHYHRCRLPRHQN